MNIGQAANAADTSRKAVRHYESLGLISPRRELNGYRSYTDHDVRILREIRTLADLGIPLEAARPFVDCLNAGSEHADDCPAGLAQYRHTIDDLTLRIDELACRREALARHLANVALRSIPHRPEGCR